MYLFYKIFLQFMTVTQQPIGIGNDSFVRLRFDYKNTSRANAEMVNIPVSHLNVVDFLIFRPQLLQFSADDELCTRAPAPTEVISSF